MVETDSRAATNRLLSDLRDGRWRLGAWGRFFGDAAVRSVVQAYLRPRAFIELTAVHGALLAIAKPRSRIWVYGAWAMAASHLGMLEARRSLSLADVLTLIRATLPATSRRSGPAVAIVALVTDVLDGHVARAAGTVSAFGAAADSLADAAFWAWFACRHEHDLKVRAAASAVWVAPVIATAAGSVAAGRMREAPRPRWIRPAAAGQGVLTVRAISRSILR